MEMHAFPTHSNKLTEFPVDRRDTETAITQRAQDEPAEAASGIVQNGVNLPRRPVV
jgi:hypothetical protein